MKNEFDQKQNKVIIGGFKTNNQNQPTDSAETFRSSNPIKRNLLKLVDDQLHKNKFNYKSFSKFKPEDLR